MARRMNELEYSYACELDRYRRIPEPTPCETCGGSRLIECDFNEFIENFDAAFRGEFIKNGYVLDDNLKGKIKDYLRRYREFIGKWVYYKNCPDC